MDHFAPWAPAGSPLLKLYSFLNFHGLILLLFFFLTFSFIWMPDSRQHEAETFFH